MCRLNMFNEAKILITGGCGYIGCNLAKELLSIGSETIVLFDLMPLKVQDEEDSNRNYAHLDYGTFRDQRHSIVYVEGDIRDYKRLNETIKSHFKEFRRFNHKLQSASTLYFVLGIRRSFDGNQKLSNKT